jgi:hypothetical protein
MFAFKLSTLEVIKLSLDMEIVLEQQHADLKTDLRATLSPGEFRKVSQVLSEHAPRKMSMLSHLQGLAAVAPERACQVRPEPLATRMQARSVCRISACLRRWNRMNWPTRTRTSLFCIRWSRSRPHLRSAMRLDSPTSTHRTDSSWRFDNLQPLRCKLT